MCKKNEVEQVFIRVKTIKDGNCNIIDKDIRDTTYEERYKYYVSISKGGIVDILERIGGFEK